ncbi:MAG: hypothetical protein FJZ61_01755 [Chlamydiae bacterium]|nr:hypothetical protein [Chlamydiota bacterium]
MNKKYVYKPYNELFSKLFLEEKRRLLNILKEKCFDIEHIGSTAISGLGGKGVIDIGITVAKENFDDSFDKIESLGYIFRENGSSPERWFFRIDLPDPQEGTRRYHLHLTFPESIEWKKLIAFRDYLRWHPSVLEEYAELKRKSAEEVNENGALYRKKKSPFFEKVLYKAMKHKIYFVIGASGSGKTTTLKRFEGAIPSNCTLLHFLKYTEDYAFSSYPPL